MIIRKVTAGPFMSNAFVAGCEETHKGFIIDTGTDGDGIAEAVEQAGLTIEAILLTHGHVDHVGGLTPLRKVFDVPVYMHREDRFFIEQAPQIATMFGTHIEPIEGVDEFRWLTEGDELRAGSLRFGTLYVPGHSPGHVAFHTRGHVFCGDVLFAGSIGRTDLPGGDFDTLISSIKSKLYPLGDDTAVYNGHGPNTTIGKERRTNPFLNM